MTQPSIVRTITMKKRILAVSIAASSLALASLAQAEVKIGFLGGFTGPIETLTPPVYEAAQLAVQHINEQGGILGGKTLVMPSGDTTCGDASAASTQPTGWSTVSKSRL